MQIKNCKTGRHLLASEALEKKARRGRLGRFGLHAIFQVCVCRMRMLVHRMELLVANAGNEDFDHAIRVRFRRPAGSLASSTR